MRKVAPIVIGAAALTTLAAMADEELERNMLSHVERILVIDTINVDRESFYQKYRLTPSTGMILTAGEVAEKLQDTPRPDTFRGEPYTGFTNEYNDYMIWAQEDTTGYLRLAESYRLLTGEWEKPKFAPTVLNFGAEMPADSAVNANTAFPFMSDDGQTLYFAADNEKSLGGYDIFISSKDPADGRFLIPMNIGMPFNSPYDDYLMVQDPLTGVGWWASDRNQLEDEVTVYIYALTPERINVDPEDENLMIYATLSGWETLLDEDSQAARKKYLEEIRNIKKADRRTPEFELPMPHGRTYRYYSDFRSNEAASLMKKYLEDKESLNKKEKNLRELRETYHERGGKQLGAKIQELEKETRSAERALKATLSEIYRKEIKN